PCRDSPDPGVPAGLVADGYEDLTLLRAESAADEERADDGGAGDPRVGTVLDDKYRIEALVGRGGMGAVYRATQLQLDRAVAVKLMHVDAVRNPDALERFRREAIAVARLKHPHIVAVHDFGMATKARAYLVMQYLEGP